MLRQTEWGKQNGSIAKNAELPPTTFFVNKKNSFQSRNLL